MEGQELSMADTCNLRVELLRLASDYAVSSQDDIVAVAKRLEDFVMGR